MRKLASIKEILEVKPIFGADKIQAYRVDGWWVVDQSGKYSVGDNVCYLEIDSWVPHTLVPFLSKGREPKEYNGVAGERLRTVKLRGQISQGLILPLEENGLTNFNIDDDVSEVLGVQKYEPPIPAQLAGTVKGNFPDFIPKTDQTRIQSLGRAFGNWKKEKSIFRISEKLDGSSMTVYRNGDDYGVCSRNLDLKDEEGNTFWKAARQQNLIKILEAYGKNIALQGELIGEGIQKNRYAISGQEFRLFDIWMIDEGRYMNSSEIFDLVSEHSIKMVFSSATPIDETTTVDSILAMAEFKSYLNPKTEAEGLVFRSEDDTSISFKAINNKFLLKGGD